jgi:cobalt/nickel transport system permease protein
MVHISDGILSLPVLAAGWAITIALLAVAIWWSKKKGNLEEEIPKLSVMTAAFFVASLIHIPVGPTSA